jgi:hypothetical protein
MPDAGQQHCWAGSSHPWDDKPQPHSLVASCPPVMVEGRRLRSNATIARPACRCSKIKMLMLMLMQTWVVRYWCKHVDMYIRYGSNG